MRTPQGQHGYPKGNVNGQERCDATTRGGMTTCGGHEDTTTRGGPNDNNARGDDDARGARTHEGAQRREGAAAELEFGSTPPFLYIFFEFVLRI